MDARIFSTVYVIGFMKVWHLASKFDGIQDINNWISEEVFSGKKAVWFSPDASKLAFIRFDDSPVRRMQVPIYGMPGAPEFQYPADLVLSYPKTGSPNPTVRLFSVDLSRALEKEELVRYEINVPTPLEVFPHIISVVAWANNNTLLSTWMNRVQNQAYVQTCENEICKPVSNFCKFIFQSANSLNALVIYLYFFCFLFFVKSCSMWQATPDGWISSKRQYLMLMAHNLYLSHHRSKYVQVFGTSK